MIILMSLIRAIMKPLLVILMVILVLINIEKPAEAGVNLKMDCTKDLLNMGNVIPSIILDKPIWTNCNNSGCAFSQVSFSTTVSSGSGGNRCEINGAQKSCTISLDAQLPGWDMRDMYGSALLAAVRQVQKEVTITELTPDIECNERGFCKQVCTEPKRSATNWLIPSKKRIYGWDTDNNYKGYMQYSIDCEDRTPKCPEWFGTLTSGIMTIPGGLPGVIGNGINFTCGLISESSGRPSILTESTEANNQIIKLEWDRNVPLSSLPENCQDGGWRNATKEIWETKYRNCPLPDLKREDGKMPMTNGKNIGLISWEVYDN